MDRRNQLTGVVFNNNSGVVSRRGRQWSAPEPGDGLRLQRNDQLLTMTVRSGQPRPVWEYGYNDAGEMTSSTDPLDRVTGYAYNGLGFLTTVTLPDLDGAGGDPAPEYIYEFDAVGNLLNRLARFWDE